MLFHLCSLLTVTDNLTTPTQLNSRHDHCASKMAKKKKKSSKPKEEARTFLIPWLHEEVVDAVSDEIALTWFHENDSDEGSNNEWPTNIMGSFKCGNNACYKKGWGSKKVAMLIRGYPRNGYNAVVYNQRCRSCEWLGILKLNEQSYIDRVAYWLKIWAGVPVERPNRRKRKKTPPHESSLCEGCRSGICQQSNEYG
jgi:hypothetical protein